MKRLCVIGDPVSHSLSPMLHGCLIEQTGVAYTYEAHTVRPQELAAFVAEGKRGAWAGCNVTMPHKQRILPLLDECTAEALACGAVNTVRFDRGRAIGHNTDGQGFLDSLDVVPRRVLLLGAGGAAEAVLSALVRQGAAVTLCNRHPERAERLSARHFDAVTVIPFTAEALAQAASAAELVVNATPLGMVGAEAFSDLSFLEHTRATVYDLVYHPQDTALLQAARRQGLATVGGRELLICQAIRAFGFFTDAAVDAVSARQMLRRRLP